MASTSSTTPRRDSPNRAEIKDALDCLRRIVSALQQSHRAAEQQWGVSAAQLLVLQQLRDSEALSINDLAERTFTHQSTVSVVVTRLVARRLVERQRSSTDARRTEIRLTTAGRRLLSEAMTLAHTRIVNALRQMSKRHVRALSRSLSMVVRELGTSRERAGMFFESFDGDGVLRSRRRRRSAASAQRQQIA